MQPALLRLGRLLRQGLGGLVTGHAIASNPSGGVAAWSAVLCPWTPCPWDDCRNPPHYPHKGEAPPYGKLYAYWEPNESPEDHMGSRDLDGWSRRGCEDQQPGAKKYPSSGIERETLCFSTHTHLCGASVKRREAVPTHENDPRLTNGLSTVSYTHLTLPTILLV